MIDIFLIVACACYALEYSLFRVAMRRVHRLEHRVPPEYPAISILVAARNEEKNIEQCLRALLGQDYPAGRVQIIVVNDESEDRTHAIMQQVAREHPGRIDVISTKPEDSHARGKARAIAQGMDHATGEIILLTDADCMPPPVWSRSVVEHFLPDVDVCGAFTLVIPEGPFSAAQQLDWIHLQTLGSCALGLGFPVGVVGNNLSFRRTAYERVGGYRAVPFTVTEDFALFQAMTVSGARAIYPCSADTQNFTLPCGTLSEVIRQKQRWARGGVQNVLPGYTIFVVAFLMLVAFTIAPFISLGAWAGVWSVKFACDLLLMLPTMRRLQSATPFRYFIIFEFYFIVQVLLIPLLLTNRTVVWKGREYRS